MNKLHKFCTRYLDNINLIQINKFIKENNFLVGISLSLLFIVGLGFWLGFYFFKPGSPTNPASITSRLLAWDGVYYLQIAHFGYQWHGVTKSPDFAFFPLYPLVEIFANSIMKIARGSWNPLVMVFPSIIFGIASIWVFFALAKQFLSEQSAQFATAAYALYPGAQFFFAGYPTSLINLLTLLSLLALFKNRIWLAAILAGLATAAGPLGALLLIPIAIKHLKKYYITSNHNQTMISIAKEALSLAFLSLISTFGLILFILYQWIIINNPFAFLQVQANWGTKPFAVRVYNFFHLYPIVGGKHFGFFPSLFFKYSHHLPQWNVERSFNSIIFVIMIGLILLLATQANKQKRLLYLMLFSIACILTYAWTIGTIEGPVSAIRLLYIVVPAFLGAGFLYEKNKFISYGLLLVFASILMVQAAFFVSGYWVV